MNLNQLRAFHAVARFGGVTEAAEQLCVSQSAVSQQLHGLEEDSGVELTVRAGRRLSLTSAGEQLQWVAERLFELEREAAELLSGLGELSRGRLRVAADSPYLVMGLVSALEIAYPGLDLQVLPGNSQQVALHLLENRADVGLSTLYEPDSSHPRMWSELLCSSALGVLVPRRHRWANRRRLSLGDLAKERLIVREEGSATRQSLEAAFQTAGLETPRTLEIGSREAVQEAVASGLGVSVISRAEFKSDPRLRFVSLRDAEVNGDVHLLCLEDRRQARVVEAFVLLARERLGAGKARGTGSACAQRA